MFAPFNVVNRIDPNRIRCSRDNIIAVCERYGMVGREFVLIKYKDSTDNLIVAVELVSKEDSGDILFGNYILTLDDRWEDGAGLRADSLVELLPPEIFNAVLVSSSVLKFGD